MKELRAYQQSEAYKMCTEKIQEKKIKKGEKGPSPQAAEYLLREGWPWRLTPPSMGLPWGEGKEGVPGRGNSTFKAEQSQRKPGRLTLPSSLPTRGLGLRAHEYPLEWTQGKYPSSKEST